MYRLYPSFIQEYHYELDTELLMRDITKKGLL